MQNRHNTENSKENIDSLKMTLDLSKKTEQKIFQLPGTKPINYSKLLQLFYNIFKEPR